MVAKLKIHIMAVNIDTVYQRVLAIANKEQRGYVTPQEFNLLANQAQLQIFEQYFYEAGRRSRTDADKVPNTEQMNSKGDVKALLDEKPMPSEDEIREALSGNLCRCTGYAQIFEAVKTAAKKLNTSEGGEG